MYSIAQKIAIFYFRQLVHWAITSSMTCLNVFINTPVWCFNLICRWVAWISWTFITHESKIICTHSVFRKNICFVGMIQAKWRLECELKWPLNKSGAVFKRMSPHCLQQGQHASTSKITRCTLTPGGQNMNNYSESKLSILNVLQSKSDIFKIIFKSYYFLNELLNWKYMHFPHHTINCRT